MARDWVCRRVCVSESIEVSAQNTMVGGLVGLGEMSAMGGEGQDTAARHLRRSSKCSGHVQVGCYSHMWRSHPPCHPPQLMFIAS
ncbi:uncharacterized protein BDR25DRAFT_70198 [Lindgomyces ingoldianus]|uniref:Uncharacterized protein n=1 Tax=Lindgomyces ingoldianus TaxID=673940 RepID=A0ACB6QMA1_9PLEO|nr:uncharacterized protein BDR25DRAFT_70198 [Lindgomyces ingoldianus]KAF2467271.1 hypothetical protein BDR25DRAFT_70198 [Lindgomyces ingoldianus]